MATQPKAGAPRGNQNALKHGFYARTFKPAERRELQAVRQLSLNAEIDMLRIVVRRVFDLTATLEDPLVAVRYVTVLTRAVSSLDRLVARQNELHNEKDEFDTNIHLALEELTDYKNERREDLKKRFAIQKATLHRRLDSIIPPPPTAWPPPDPATLPKPNRDLDKIDPYCSYYENHEPEYYDVYGETSPIGSRFDDSKWRGLKPVNYIHPDDVMEEIRTGKIIDPMPNRRSFAALANFTQPPPAPAPAPAQQPAPPCGDPDVDADPLIDDPSTWDTDEDDPYPPLT